MTSVWPILPNSSSGWGGSAPQKLSPSAGAMLNVSLTKMLSRLAYPLSAVCSS
jgi:hypothetical protein